MRVQDLFWSEDNLHLGMLKMFPGRCRPFVHSFAKDGALFFISDSEIDTQTYTQGISTKLAMRYRENFHLHIFDPLHFGAHLDRVARLHSDVKSHRVQTDPDGLTEVLRELRYRIGAVNQDILSGDARSRNLPQYIAENEQTNEKIHCLIVNGFPYRWDNKSLSLFLDIIRLGPKAGVFSIILVNPAVGMATEGKLAGGKIQALLREGRALFYHSGQWELFDEVISRRFTSRAFVEFPNDESDRNEYEDVEEVNKQILLAKDKRVDIVSDVEVLAMSGRQNNEVLEIPIGKKGNGQIQYFELGDKNSCYHALVGGATGSGKTVLLHNIISFGSMLYSPEELQFCLLDYKEGTEFQNYEGIPHVRILAIESQLSFGTSFLSYMQNLIKERGEFFKSLSVANIKDARSKTSLPIPRILIIIDEFQVLLSDGSRDAQKVSQMLDDISKRGRSFGVHLVLSTQSLAGVGLRLSTLGQISLRLALRISKDDSERILESGNLEPAFFKRRGQAILNENSGQVTENKYFTVSYVSDSDVKKIKAASQDKYHAFRTENSVASRIFDPRRPVRPDRIACEVRNRGNFVLGEPFYMNGEAIHCFPFKTQRAASTMFCGRKDQFLLQFCRIIFWNLPVQEEVCVLDDGDQKFSAELAGVLRDRAVRTVGTFEDLNEWLYDEEKCKGPRHLIVPDLNGNKLFAPRGYSKSEVSELILRLAQGDFGDEISLHVGLRSRTRSRDQLELSKLLSEIDNVFILSNGTEFAAEFGSLSENFLAEGMAHHYSKDFEGGSVTFKPFNL